MEEKLAARSLAGASPPPSKLYRALTSPAGWANIKRDINGESCSISWTRRKWEQKEKKKEKRVACESFSAEPHKYRVAAFYFTRSDMPYQVWESGAG